MKRELKGRKVKGFYFEDFEHNGLGYSKQMDAHIGEVGEIISHDKEGNTYEVRFKKDIWTYPAELIKQHLVEENPLDNLPMLGKGVLCEVWDAHTSPFEWLVVAKTPNGYLASKKGDYVFLQWPYARPIEPVKQYTKEQLEEMVGHKFQLI